MVQGIRLVCWILISCVGLLCGATFWKIVFPTAIPMPQLMLVCLLYASGLYGNFVRRKVDSVMVVGFGCLVGYVADLLGSTPVGLQSLLLGFTGLALCGLAKKLLIRSRLIGGIIAMILVFLYHILLFVMRSILTSNANWQELWYLPSLCIATAACAPLLFALFTKLDETLFKSSDKRASL